MIIKITNEVAPVIKRISKEEYDEFLKEKILHGYYWTLTERGMNFKNDDKKFENFLFEFLDTEGQLP